MKKKEKKNIGFECGIFSLLTHLSHTLRARPRKVLTYCVDDVYERGI